jgi:hypothetical protein
MIESVWVELLVHYVLLVLVIHFYIKKDTINRDRELEVMGALTHKIRMFTSTCAVLVDEIKNIHDQD